jgi:hypothetical protein
LYLEIYLETCLETLRQRPIVHGREVKLGEVKLGLGEGREECRTSQSAGDLASFAI